MLFVRLAFQADLTALLSSPLLLMAGAFLGRPAKASRLFFFLASAVPCASTASPTAIA
jgi:hypothetical protein